MTTMRTYAPSPTKVERHWRVIDASGRPIGRLASEIAQVLKGKDKPIYAPNADTGDFVIVVNSSKVGYSGKKLSDKKYYSHSLYPGGLKTMTLERMLTQHPNRVIEYAVWGMLPKNHLGRSLMRRLKVYSEAAHPHSAQNKNSASEVVPGRARKKAKPAPTPKTVASAASTPVAPATPARRTRAARTHTAARRAPATPKTEAPKEN